MPKYLCIQRSQIAEAGNRSKPSPAEMQDMYAKFNTWMEKFRENLVDMGGKLGNGKVVTADGAKDGPFAESKEIIGGYMIVSAKSLDEAVEIASACPGLVSPGSGVEVRGNRTP